MVPGLTYAADLHIHSSFARATSKELNLENLAHWARLKGINLLASGDFTHPAWFSQIRRKLVESSEGLYEFEGVRFILGAEVNCVAEQRGRHRRIHALVFAPSLEVAERVNRALAAKGDLTADGRPTLRMSPRQLLRTLLDIDSRCLLIPAHAWTPWFGIYGSKSGFDSLEECFGDDARHVYAVETGLSSDPAMNWRIPELDDVSIVSFSDAHSLPKLGRELTVIDGELSYTGLVDSLKRQSIAYTVEFFPEEGKYHYSGHRKCGVSYSPGETEERKGRCPACGRRLTLGVMQRVEELAAREVATRTRADGLIGADNGRPPFKSLVALQQIIAESMGRGVNTKGVRSEYLRLVGELGNELSLLMEVPLADVLMAAGERIADGVGRVRRGEVVIEPGYDGVYGTVRVWPGA